MSIYLVDPTMYVDGPFEITRIGTGTCDTCGREGVAVWGSPDVNLAGTYLCADCLLDGAEHCTPVGIVSDLESARTLDAMGYVPRHDPGMGYRFANGRDGFDG